jgi:hypothetical protein
LYCLDIYLEHLPLELAILECTDVEDEVELGKLYVEYRISVISTNWHMKQSALAF